MSRDETGDKNAFRRLNTWFAGTLVGSFIYSRVLHYIDRFVFRLTGGRTFLSGLLAGIPVVLLVTQGRKTGARREVPIIAVPDDGRFVLLASNWGNRHHPAWYYNLLEDSGPRIRTRNGEQPHSWRYAEAEKRGRLWNRAVELYPGWAAYQRRIGDARDIPILVLTPKTGAGSAADNS